MKAAFPALDGDKKPEMTIVRNGKKKYDKMKAIYNSCLEADVSLPEEVVEYFKIYSLDESCFFLTEEMDNEDCCFFVGSKPSIEYIGRLMSVSVDIEKLRKKYGNVESIEVQFT